MSAPPGKRNAAPGKPERDSFGKQVDADTLPPDAQGYEGPLLKLARAWRACGLNERRLFLAEVRGLAPNLWRDIERDFVASKLRRFATGKRGYGRAR
jgi:hypothetical protein